MFVRIDLADLIKKSGDKVVDLNSKVIRSSVDVMKQMKHDNLPSKNDFKLILKVDLNSQKYSNSQVVQLLTRGTKTESPL